MREMNVYYGVEYVTDSNMVIDSKGGFKTEAEARTYAEKYPFTNGPHTSYKNTIIIGNRIYRYGERCEGWWWERFYEEV